MFLDLEITCSGSPLFAARKIRRMYQEAGVPWMGIHCFPHVKPYIIVVPAKGDAGSVTKMSNIPKVRISVELLRIDRAEIG